MTAIHRRSQRDPISIAVTLATADDVDGTADNTQAYDVTGASRAILYQINDGTAGTLGIDVVEYSYDGGSNWEAASDVLPDTANDATGTIQASGALNAAGVEPTGVAVFKCGPFPKGTTAIRISREAASGSGTDWATGAPTVKMVLVGQTSGTPTALA